MLKLNLDNKELNDLADTAKKSLVEAEKDLNKNLSILNKQGETNLALKLSKLAERAKSGKLSLIEFSKEANKLKANHAC